MLEQSSEYIYLYLLFKLILPIGICSYYFYIFHF
jgi:hypothetical protein